MKKISFIFALLAAMLPMVVSAESRTVKIHIDEPSRIREIKCGDYGVDKVYTIGDDNCIEVTFGDNKENGDIKQLNLYAVADARLVGITREDGSAPKYDGAYAWGSPVSVYDSGTYIYFSGFGGSWTGFGVVDGETLYVETKELPSKIFTFKGNSDEMSVQTYNSSLFKYEDLEPKEAGIWEINGNGMSQMQVAAKAGYLISSIKDSEDKELSSSTMVTSKIIYSSSYEGDVTFNVATISEEDARTASFTLKMPVDADITVQRNGKAVELENVEEQTVKFNPLNSETSIKVTRKSDSSRKFYEATFTPTEGDAQTASSVASYTFTVSDGGVLEINPEFPDVDIPVHFSFVNEGTEASITSVKVNGTALEDGAWLAEDFSVKLSDKIELTRNTDDYEFKGNWISINGTASTNTSFEVLDTEIEGGYTVEITSRKYEVYNVTIIAPANKYLDVKITTEINYNPVYTPIEFNEEGMAEVTVKENATRIEFGTKTGLYNYISRYVIDNDTEEVMDNKNYYGTNDGRVPIEYIKDGMTLKCIVEKKRTEKATVYLEDADWASTDMLLEAGDVFEAAVALTPGDYTEVSFAKVNDKLPNDFAAASFAALGESPVVYVNDVKQEEELNVQAGDLVKVFTEEKEPVTINYTIEEGVNVSITHDKVNAIETPASHTVLPGTHVHITPIATMADEADDDEILPTPVLKVSCNGTNVEPDENGVFALKANADSEIKVYNDSSVSISEITEDSASEKVYDLQGRRVNGSAKGIVISKGKIMIRK